MRILFPLLLSWEFGGAFFLVRCSNLKFVLGSCHMLFNNFPPLFLWLLLIRCWSFQIGSVYHLSYLAYLKILIFFSEWFSFLRRSIVFLILAIIFLKTERFCCRFNLFSQHFLLFPKCNIFFLFFNKDFCWCGPFFLKSLLNLLQYCFCFYVLFFWPQACGILVPWPGIKPTTPGEGES